VSESNSTNITWHEGQVSRSDRQGMLGQRGCTVWLTGLSGSGKSTIAVAAEKVLVARGKVAYVLDGDNVRHGLNSNLGFSPEDRTENIRRIGEVGKLFVDTGVITLTAFISPYLADRQIARETVGEGNFFEVFCDTPLEVCEERDPKGLYKKARAGEIKNFTGIDDPYEVPVEAEIHLHTDEMTVAQEVQIILDHLENNGFIISQHLTRADDDKSAAAL